MNNDTFMQVFISDPGPSTLTVAGMVRGAATSVTIGSFALQRPDFCLGQVQQLRHDLHRQRHRVSIHKQG
jgi:hypothetical protein